MLTKAEDSRPHFERDYEIAVANLKASHSLEEAMTLAVGGGDRSAMGKVQYALLREAGMVAGNVVIDLGCGSGRTAEAIAASLDVDYLGIDVVQDLLDYAEKICPSHYRFLRSAKLYIPAPAGSADLIFSFSLLTHLLYEESYLYLRDAFRVLKPNGRMLFSFLEFDAPTHWAVFEGSVNQTVAKTKPHMNTFIERPVINLWAQKLGFNVERYFDGLQPIVDDLILGQSAVLLSKP